MKETMSVNVMHGEQCLKTLTVAKHNKLVCFDNAFYSFPDTNTLYCEDIEGMRYKRLLLAHTGTRMIFEQI